MDSKKSKIPETIIQYYCFISEQEKIIIWAKDTGAAQAACLARTGKEAVKIIPVLTRDSASPVMVIQKNLQGLLDNTNLVLFIWLVVVALLFRGYLPKIDFSQWGEFRLPGAGLFLIAFLAHYFRLLFTAELVALDPFYGNKTHVLLLNAVLCAIFIGITLVFLPMNSPKVKDIVQQLGFLLALFLVVYPFIFAFRGGFRGLRKMSAYHSLLERLKSFPYTLGLLSLFSLPAIAIAAEAGSTLLAMGLKPIVNLIRTNPQNIQKLFTPAYSLRLQAVILFFIVFGPIVYALLILSFSKIIPSLDKNGALITSKNIAGRFIAGYGLYLAELLLNVLIINYK